MATLLESCEYPAEYLRNPSHWLEAEKMEDLLALFMREGNRLSRDGNLIQESGHQCKELRAWGVLDSVLRMVQSPKDLFSQPDRLLSYFVSPAPPVGNILREPEGIFFEVPIAATQYPLVTEYLRAAMEALPTYAGKPMATVQWTEIRVSISWSESQESLFDAETAATPHLSPDLVRGILHNLETTQKQLEETKRLLAERERELKILRCAAIAPVPTATTATGALSSTPMNEATRWMGLAEGLKAEMSGPTQDVLNHIFRLNDYMVRAQQLVTLLVGQGRMTPQVQEAMRRVDWPLVRTEAPNVVKAAAVGVRKIQDVLKDLALLAAEREPRGDMEIGRDTEIERKVSTDLNSVVAHAIENVRAELPRRIQIDEHLLLDREVLTHPKPIERAIANLVKNAVQAIEGNGTVRVVTRPNGGRAEIEIADTGIGMNESTVQRAFEPFFTTQTPGTAAGLGLSLAQAIVRGHDGTIQMNSQPNGGTTVVVSLPLGPVAPPTV